MTSAPPSAPKERSKPSQQETAVTAAEPTRRPNRRAVMVSAVLTQLMIVLDLTIIAIALPRIQEDLGMTPSESPWTVTGYSLAFGGLVLFGGRLCAVAGIRRSYQVGLTGFAVASLAAGMAPSFPVLLVSRVAQGCSGALLAPTAQALLNVTFTERTERERVFAIFGATGGLGAAVGLLLGGALTDWLSWRWALYVNIFIAAAALLIGQRSLPPADRRDHTSRITDDLSGLALGCGACFSAVYGLDRAQQTSWTSTSTLAWLVVGGLAAVLFIIRERFANRPVLPLSMMATPVRAASYATQFIAGAAQMGAIIYLTYYMQNHFGYSPFKSGVVFLPMVAALVATAIPAGRVIVPRLGARGTLPLGLAVLTGSFLIFSRMTTESTYWQVALPGLIVFGIGLGLTMPVTFNSGTRGVEARRTGLASAILSAAQQIGGSFGVALMTSYATQHVQDYVTDHTEEVKAAATEAMMRAQTLPQSPAGKQIVEALRAQLIDRAQIEAYSGGFTMMAWVLAGAAAVLVVCGIGLSLHRRRTR
ncbi:MFS transporter [Actinomyces viscosus]|uniref:Spectinomycin tetracycline efflux pump n=1 Tax=Actinomyces viscosus TaxID=1656 RepID=A0A448PPQ6_ACTVI|nr:MFS transporter [Actinomyces viscosus]TFH51221.1 MFS transporter [Actinomyces viscosus]VEI18724.1 Spectinomycin tetracycline efflux pump [Actinomyces viscosus]